MPMSEAAGPLVGRRILVLEDEFLIADAMDDGCDARARMSLVRPRAWSRPCGSLNARETGWMGPCWT